MFSYHLLLVFFLCCLSYNNLQVFKKNKTKKPQIRYKKMIAFGIIIYFWVSDFFSYDYKIINDVILKFKYCKLHHITLYFLILNLRYENLHKNWRQRNNCFIWRH